MFLQPLVADVVVPATFAERFADSFVIPELGEPLAELRAVR